MCTIKKYTFFYVYKSYFIDITDEILFLLILNIKSTIDHYPSPKKYIINNKK